MKIEVLSIDKGIPVGKIDPGQCFRVDGKPQVFMMIESTNHSSDHHLILEAVNIETGSRMVIHNSRMLVTPVCVEATIFEEV